MPRGDVLGKPIDEAKWIQAKSRATEEGYADDYAYIMAIYKNMAHLVASVHKAMPDHMRLVLVKGELDEFRCGACHALLFKGLNLEKSLIEVKCRSCGTLLVSNALLML